MMHMQSRASARIGSTQPAAGPGAGTAGRRASHRRPRDVGANVFGTWRTPPLAERIDLRRFLDAIPLAGNLLLPRAEQIAQQAQQRQQQQQQAAQQRLAPPPVATAEGKKPLRLGWAGSGVYFWWQLGAMQYMAERYDLTGVPMAGASGGAICAALAMCGVDATEAAAAAYRLSQQHDIWSKPMGLAGSWGGVIEGWLDALLPADAADRCRGRLSVIVTQLPSCQQIAISDFTDKADLINCIMASAHVPLLLDGNLTRDCRGVACVDGSFPDFFTGENCDFLTCGGDAVVYDYFMDSAIIRNGRFDMLSLKRYSAIRKIVVLGARYAARLEAAGEFDRFDSSAVRRQQHAAVTVVPKVAAKEQMVPTEPEVVVLGGAAALAIAQAPAPAAAAAPAVVNVTACEGNNDVARAR